VIKLTQLHDDEMHSARNNRRDLQPVCHTQSPTGEHIMLNWETVEAPPRKLDTVFLPPSVTELLEDIDSFLRKRSWYMKRSFKYQRVYMLHGPPGNGKSSFLQALAVQHSLPLYVLQLSGGEISKTACRASLSATAKMPCVVPVEDAESCFAARDANAEPEPADDYRRPGGGDGRTGRRSGRGGRGNRPPETPVTAKEFVQLLTAEDEKPPNGRIIIFTTNTIDMLEPALKVLIRESGREVEFPNATEPVRRRMWLNFYCGERGTAAELEAAEAQYETFQRALSEVAGPAASFGVSAYQGFLMRYRDTPTEATKAELIAAHLIAAAKNAVEPGAAAGTTSAVGEGRGWKALRQKQRQREKVGWMGIGAPQPEEEAPRPSRAGSARSGSVSTEFSSWSDYDSYPTTPLKELLEIEYDADEFDAASLAPLPPTRGDTAASQLSPRRRGTAPAAFAALAE